MVKPKVDETSALQELQDRLKGSNVEAQLRKGGEPGLLGAEGIDDATLLRWLRAENLSVDKAEGRLRKHAAWRADFVPNARIAEAEIQPELDAGKAFIQGVDKLGRSVSVVICSKHSRSSRDLEQCKRFICYCLDVAVATNDLDKNPLGRTSAIFDLRGLTLDCLDNAVLRACFDMLQSHYPERLSLLYMLDAPTLFWGLWKMVSPFIDPVTRDKIKFVYGEEGRKAMQSTIAPEVLPKKYGGEADFIPVQDFAKLLATAIRDANSMGVTNGTSHSQGGSQVATGGT